MFWKVHRQPTGNELSIGKKRVCSKTRSKTFSQAETQDRLMSHVEEIYGGLGWARPCVRLCRYLKIEHLRLGLMERALKWRREGGHWDVPPPPRKRVPAAGMLPPARPQQELPSGIVWARKTTWPGMHVPPTGGLQPVTGCCGSGRSDSLIPVEPTLQGHPRVMTSSGVS